VTQVVPDLLLSSGYTSPAISHVDFVVYRVGEDPGTPEQPAGTVNVAVSLSFQSARARTARRLDTGWSPPPRKDGGLSMRWQPGVASERSEASAWGRVAGADAGAGSGWQAAVAHATLVSSLWGGVLPADAAAASPFLPATPVPPTGQSFSWNRVYPKDVARLTPWTKAKLPVSDPGTKGVVVPVEPTFDQRVPRGDRLVFALREGARDSVAFLLQRRVLYGPVPAGHIDFILEEDDGPDELLLTGASPYVPTLSVVLSAGYVRSGDPVVLGTTPAAKIAARAPVAPTYRDPSPFHARWAVIRLADKQHLVRWGHGPQVGPREPPPYEFPHGSTSEPPPIPDSQRVYIVMNSVEVVVLPDRIPLNVDSVDVEASVDSWCWTVRMDLADPGQVALLKPSATGPKSVEITMNGYQWVAIIEGRDSSRAHVSNGGRTASVSGRSQTALLSDSYTARRSLSVSEAKTAQQIALAEVSDRALPFVIEWDGIDWVVPGGVFSYQDQAPIDVISQIAAARGAVVQSTPDGVGLLIRARYPASPWNWSADTSDIALPLDWVGSESAQQQSKPLYDAVFVMGQQQGVICKVVRDGAAGETFAAQVVDSLIVTSDVGRERGRNVLGDRGMQDLVSVEIPLFPAGTITAGSTGLYVPLMLVDVVDPADPYQALAVGVSISARRSDDEGGGLEIWQTVSLERHMTDAN